MIAEISAGPDAYRIASTRTRFELQAPIPKIENVIAVKAFFMARFQTLLDAFRQKQALSDTYPTLLGCEIRNPSRFNDFAGRRVGTPDSSPLKRSSYIL